MTQAYPIGLVGANLPAMLPEQDIWRSAAAMIKRYGPDAESEAVKRATELQALGDVDGAATWIRVIEVLKRIQAVKPDEGENRH